MTTVIESRQEKAMPQDIENIEVLLGTPLPEEYRVFLAEHNGGVPTPDTFAFTQDGISNQGTVRHFFMAKGTGMDSIRGNLHVYGKRVPANLLPIAADPCGNLLCLGIAGKDRGKVYFWDHDFECNEGEEPDFQNVSWVADSLTTFLDHLQHV